MGAICSLILKFSWTDFFLYFRFLFSILKDFFKFWMNFIYLWGFPCGSAGKESTCNAGEPSSISGSGRSSGEGIGYPIQYSSASLVTQLVKNLPAMRETWVQSLGWEDPLEKGTATHSSILAWRIRLQRGFRVTKSWTWLSDFHFHFGHSGMMTFYHYWTSRFPEGNRCLGAQMGQTT